MQPLHGHERFDLRVELTVAKGLPKAAEVIQRFGQVAFGAEQMAIDSFLLEISNRFYKISELKSAKK